MFDALTPKPADPLLAIIGMFAADQRSHKIDLGVGVYRDMDGVTPVMRTVKVAEQRLLEQQTSKSYLGLAGDVGFVDCLGELAFDSDANWLARSFGLQTPGGSGALRLGTELIHASNPNGKIWLGTPSWGNHAPIFSAVGCEVVYYNYFDVTTQTLQFESMLDALSDAVAGDVVLLQACCHNPTGADLSLTQWQSISELCCAKGLVPFIDVAYQGLGVSLEVDLAGVNAMLSQVPEALVTVSCSKNFGLYRERTGALYVLSANVTEKANASSNAMALARTNYSMPPDHGAVVVRMILEDPELRAQWQQELVQMQSRIKGTRLRLAAALGDDHTYIMQQQGMFSTLNLTPEQIHSLREDQAIYMAGDGRINVAGFSGDEIERFAEAVRPLLGS